MTERNPSRLKSKFQAAITKFLKSVEAQPPTSGLSEMEKRDSTERWVNKVVDSMKYPEQLWPLSENCHGLESNQKELELNQGIFPVNQNRTIRALFRIGKRPLAYHNSSSSSSSIHDGREAELNATTSKEDKPTCRQRPTRQRQPTIRLIDEINKEANGKTRRKRKLMPDLEHSTFETAVKPTRAMVEVEQRDKYQIKECSLQLFRANTLFQSGDMEIPLYK